MCSRVDRSLAWLVGIGSGAGRSRAGSAGAVIIGLGATLAGCSADFTRLNATAPGITETNSIPTPSEPVGRADGGRGAADSGAYMPPLPRDQPPSRGWSEDRGQPPARGGISNTGLPEPRQGQSAQPRIEAQPAPQRAAAPLPPAAGVGAGLTPLPQRSGGEFEVVRGDTLYSISRRHGVSVAELMTTNNLRGPDIKPGQRLMLPGSNAAPGSAPVAQRTAPAPGKEPVRRTATRPLDGSLRPQARGQASVPGTVAPIASAPPSVPAAASVGQWTGSYEVKSGDSLYGIARRHNVKVEDLQQVNGVVDARKVKPGMQLKVPGGAAASAAPAPIKTAEIKPTAKPAAAAAQAPPLTTKPTIILNGGAAPPADQHSETRPLGGSKRDNRVASLNQTSTKTDMPVASGPAAEPAKPVVTGGAMKFRWPVKGRVIAEYGPRADGSHNDGINLLVPAGTEVLAAEAGEVAYAGNELKSYGNLVLVRHANGWVTAYAHNEQLLVKRGDKIKRGQAVAKAGKSGSVEQPQVHFEIRQGSKPIDPTPHMEKM